VELALALPLIAVFGLAIVQVALVARLDIGVAHAAREAARTVAIEHDIAAASRAAAHAAGLDPARVTVDVDGMIRSGQNVAVTVTYSAPTDVAFVGRLVGDVELTATTVMRVE
jgi:Flp pilus assembly protein TadG